ncbi:MAG: GAP family protein [Microcella sp.]
MLDALGDALPLAAAIALSPLAVASVVLMLLSPNARAATLSFLLGFAGAIAAVASIAYLVALLLPHDADDRSVSAPFLLIGLGLVAIVLAVRQWRSRPATEEGGETRVPEVPGWMAKIDGMTPAKAAALGAFIGGLKPKNLLLSIGVGVTLEAADATVGEAAVALGIVVLLGSLPVIIPVIVSFVAGDRIREPLDRLRAWLIVHNAAMVGAILLLIGVVLISKGAEGLGG